MTRRDIDELVFPDSQRVAVWAERRGNEDYEIRIVLDED